MEKKEKYLSIMQEIENQGILSIHKVNYLIEKMTDLYYLDDEIYESLQDLVDIEYDDIDKALGITVESRLENMLIDLESINISFDIEEILKHPEKYEIYNEYLESLDKK